MFKKNYLQIVWLMSLVTFLLGCPDVQFTPIDSFGKTCKKWGLEFPVSGSTFYGYKSKVSNECGSASNRVNLVCGEGGVISGDLENLYPFCVKEECTPQGTGINALIKYKSNRDEWGDPTKTKDPLMRTTATLGSPNDSLCKAEVVLNNLDWQPPGANLMSAGNGCTCLPIQGCPAPQVFDTTATPPGCGPCPSSTYYFEATKSCGACIDSDHYIDGKYCRLCENGKKRNPAGTGCDPATVTHKITFSVSPDGAGTVSCKDKGNNSIYPLSGNEFTINAGSNVSCSASPINPALKQFDKWSGHCSGTASCEFTSLSGSKTINAEFVNVTANSFPVASKAEPAGAGTVTCDKTSVTSGGSSTCSQGQSTGYTFSRWTLDPSTYSCKAGATSATGCEVANITAAITVTANYTVNNKTVVVVVKDYQERDSTSHTLFAGVTINSNQSPSVTTTTASPLTYSVAQNASPSFTIPANWRGSLSSPIAPTNLGSKKYLFKEWQGCTNASFADGSCTKNLSSETASSFTVTAYYQQVVDLIVQTKKNENGSTSPLGSVSITYSIDSGANQNNGTDPTNAAFTVPVAVGSKLIATAPMKITNQNFGFSEWKQLNSSNNEDPAPIGKNNLETNITKELEVVSEGIKIRAYYTPLASPARDSCPGFNYTAQNTPEHMIQSIYCRFLFRDPRFNLPGGTTNVNTNDVNGVAFWTWSLFDIRIKDASNNPVDWPKLKAVDLLADIITSAQVGDATLVNSEPKLFDRLTAYYLKLASERVQDFKNNYATGVTFNLQNPGKFVADIFGNLREALGETGMLTVMYFQSPAASNVDRFDRYWDNCFYPSNMDKCSPKYLGADRNFVVDVYAGFFGRIPNKGLGAIVDPGPGYYYRKLSPGLGAPVFNRDPSKTNKFLSLYEAMLLCPEFWSQNVKGSDGQDLLIGGAKKKIIDLDRTQLISYLSNLFFGRNATSAEETYWKSGAGQPLMDAVFVSGLDKNLDSDGQPQYATKLVYIALMKDWLNKPDFCSTTAGGTAAACDYDTTTYSDQSKLNWSDL